MAIGPPLRGTIADTTDVDVFRIDLAGKAAVTFATAGPTDTRGVLRDGAGEMLASDDASGPGGNNFRITADLAPGTYYLDVSGATGNYAVNAELQTAGVHGDTAALSTLLTLYSEADEARIKPSALLSSSGRVDAAEADLGMFRLDTAKDVTDVTIRSLGRTDAYARLLDSSQNELARDGRDGFLILATLEAGIHCIEVGGREVGNCRVLAWGDSREPCPCAKREDDREGQGQADEPMNGTPNAEQLFERLRVLSGVVPANHAPDPLCASPDTIEDLDVGMPPSAPNRATRQRLPPPGSRHPRPSFGGFRPQNLVEGTDDPPASPPSFLRPRTPHSPDPGHRPAEPALWYMRRYPMWRFPNELPQHPESLPRRPHGRVLSLHVLRQRATAHKSYVPRFSRPPTRVGSYVVTNVPPALCSNPLIPGGWDDQDSPPSPMDPTSGNRCGSKSGALAARSHLRAAPKCHALGRDEGIRLMRTLEWPRLHGHDCRCRQNPQRTREARGSAHAG